jgi:hypothetical protein
MAMNADFWQWLAGIGAIVGAPAGYILKRQARLENRIDKLEDEAVRGDDLTIIRADLHYIRARVDALHDKAD